MFGEESEAEKELMEELGTIGVEETDVPAPVADPTAVEPPVDEPDDPDDNPVDPNPAPAAEPPKTYGQFNSAEELLDAYTKQQAAITFLRHQAPGTADPGKQQPGQVPQPDDAFWDQLQENPKAAVQELVNAALAPIQQERQMETLTRNLDPIAKHYEQMHTEDGIAQFYGKVSEIANEMGNPSLIRNPSPRILRMAAEELWGRETREKAYRSGVEKGREEAEVARRNKQQLDVKVTPKTQESKSPVDEVADAILEAGREKSWFQ